MAGTGTEEEGSEGALDIVRHTPVLLEESLHALSLRPGGIYIDATGGEGGHAVVLGKALGGEGTLIVCDRDPEAVRRIKARLEQEKIRAECLVLNFRDLLDLKRGLSGLSGQVDGILADLGLSSYQLGNEERGFGFRGRGPLDMRMNRDIGQTAAELLNSSDAPTLVQIFENYGEIAPPLAQDLARRIVAGRAETPFSSTQQLVSLAASAYGHYYRGRSRRHPATRVFQALRIAVNDEMEALRIFLEAVPVLLKVGGRLAVIAFHSLEDRIVKRGLLTPGWRVLTKKPILPSRRESLNNPRARSAKLRVASWEGRA